jgi:NodT family efflux transporter outer membrane factor (OMF) lipoprotein
MASEGNTHPTCLPRLPKTQVGVALVLLLVSGSGCQLTEWAHNGYKVGPNYAQPQAPVAAQWIDYRDPRLESEPQHNGEWWRVFNDPVLDSLVENVYAQNLSLRAAGARIEAARSTRDIAVGNLFPQTQQAGGALSVNKASTQAPIPSPEQWFKDANTGVAASWELDFWGRYRRSIESADAELDAAVADYDDVLVILLAEVASNYVQYRTYEKRLVLARLNVELQTKGYTLTDDKFKLGQTTGRDPAQAKQVLEQTKALIPPLEIGQRQAGNRLSVLLGVPPHDMTKLLGTADAVPIAPKEAALGVPADLVSRRPDVRRAEREVAAQSARIGVAQADFYPRISLTGSIGVDSEHLREVFNTPGTLVGTFGPSFRWDILNYGRILNNVRVQDARFRELVFTYQNQVLTAAQEAEDALIEFLKTQERAERLNASVEAAARGFQISNDQFKEGLVDYTPVVLFANTLTEQQDQFTFAQGEIALSLIRLYKALGGGWEMRLQRNAGPGASGVLPVPQAIPDGMPVIPPGKGIPPAKIEQAGFAIDRR